jgi:amidase
VAAAEEAGRLLESLGHAVEPGFPRALEDVTLTGHFTTVFGVWTADDLDRWATMAGKPVTEADVEPGTWLIAELGRPTTGTQYLQATTALHAWSRRMAEWWSEYDLLLTPTLSEIPPQLGEFAPLPDNALRGMVRSAALVPFTLPFNVTGQPAVSVPLHWSDSGLPVGVQLVASYGREDVLVRVAAQLEQARPWADRRPPLSA